MLVLDWCRKGVAGQFSNTYPALIKVFFTRNLDKTLWLMVNN
ncbi:hypothetical protein HMPREF9176_0045 [Streptococcus downei F0415]|nr:hypothetical protein HMPREF9176_0045 [Streptococcus downei F0415]